MFKILQDRYYGLESRQKLYNAAKGNIDFVQRLKLHNKIEVHSGCVNTICWNETGQYLLSGSDDQHLIISEPFTGKFTSVRSGHRANIFSAKFLPYTSERIVSCSGDGKICYTDVDTSSRTNVFDCHFGTTYEVVVIPSESSTFLSCGEDGTVRWFDLRAKTSCQREDCKEDILINCRRAVTSLVVNPLIPYELGIACADSSVRIYDRRMLGTRASGSHSSKGITGMICKFTAPTLSNRPHRITSLAYSPNGDDILVSYSSEYIYLFGSRDYKTKKLQAPAEIFKKTKHRGDQIPKKFKSSDLLADMPSTSKAPPKAKETDPQPTPRSPLVPPADLPPSSTPPHTSSSPRQSTSEGVTSMLLPQNPSGSGSSLRQPPIKRLRLRGDWSDTGPHARPESERQTNEQPDRQTTIMQRMSDMLTRWLDGNLRRQEEDGREEGGDEVQGANSEDQASGGQAEENGTEGGDEIVREPSVVEEMETENTPDSDRLQNFSSHQDSSVENQDNVSCGDNLQSVCDKPNVNSKPSAIPKPSSLSRSQTAVSDSGVNVTQSGPSEASRGIANHEQIWGPQEGRNIISGEQRRHQAGLLVEEEPVISLHYSSEGTTSSTVRLGFARFENLEAGILQRSAENASLQPLVRETTPTGNRDLESHTTEVTTQMGNSVKDNKEENRDSVGFSDSTDSSDIFDSDSCSAESAKVDSGEQCESAEGKEGADSITESHETKNVSKTLAESGSDNQPSTSSEGQPRRAGRRDASAAVKEKIRQIGRMRILERLCREGVSGSQQDRHTDDGGTSEEEELPVPRGISHTDDRTTGSVAAGGSEESRTGTTPHSGQEDVGSDEEGEGQRDTLERHITAIRLQELYKKRQEERENEEIEMRSIHQPLHKIKFKGHRNARTMIKEANFWGDQFVMSGSDCGHIFIWDRYTAKLAMLLEADRHVVNCLQPHPYDPILASSGIDYDIKLWMPLEENPKFEEEVAAEIMRRNEVMLEETRDTITVPAAFMLRVLASLNQIRAGRASSNSEAVAENDSSSSDSE
ncbi:DDB1- and CUL4-associated factor 6-like [Saccostrea echinata]|uniref:DDB1- and CUL4-associated factor 6-like n=1 Tax=Saccostrea echinata TaxID=191078 RepID=UPI002A7EE327|nr:DDB1- and CUL4-associated factor 6-like [Saccostrea echinata]XP_061176586.1 DDB1- and CUL4-associated factor 6-like [Saccostrea echinata]